MKIALSFDDVLLIPKYSDINSRSEVDLTSKISPYLTLKIPLVTTKMDTVTGIDMAIAMGKLGGMGILPRFDAPKVQIHQVSQVKKEGVIVAAAIGVKPGFIDQAELLVSAGAEVINLDVAHGHMRQAIDATAALKNKFGQKITVISGIAATADAATDLYQAGADCILVGVGGSPICTTRVETGCGLPTFASLMDIASVARKFNKTFMPDSGVRNSGDIVKSLATGASAIVGGFIFAGCDEAPGKKVKLNNCWYKEYNGSTSAHEKAKHVKRYAHDKSPTYTHHIEGAKSLVPYRGSIASVVKHLLAGVRSGLSYVGARNIVQLWTKAEFVQITTGGVRENGMHDAIPA